MRHASELGLVAAPGRTDGVSHAFGQRSLELLYQAFAHLEGQRVSELHDDGVVEHFPGIARATLDIEHCIVAGAVRLCARLVVRLRVWLVRPRVWLVTLVTGQPL